MNESDLGYTLPGRILVVRPKTALERKKRKKRMTIVKLFALHANARKQTITIYLEVLEQDDIFRIFNIELHNLLDAIISNFRIISALATYSNVNEENALPYVLH